MAAQHGEQNGANLYAKRCRSFHLLVFKKIIAPEVLKRVSVFIQKTAIVRMSIVI